MSAWKRAIEKNMDYPALLGLQSLQVDVNSKTANKVSHGFFAASATCSQLSFHHVAFPDNIIA
jgi:hypothetical protein